MQGFSQSDISAIEQEAEGQQKDKNKKTMKDLFIFIVVASFAFLYSVAGKDKILQCSIKKEAIAACSRLVILHSTGIVLLT